MTEMTRAWDAVAEAWDSRADVLEQETRPTVTALLDAVAIQPGDRVLELAAGPGTLGPTWSALVGPQGRVVLSDVAPAMVDVARRRNEGHGNVEVDTIDLSRIDRPDRSFDVVACRMGLMFTPDPASALAEMRRVLVTGGRLGVLTWGGMQHNPWMTCVGMAAMMNGVVSGGPPVGPGGIFSLGDADGLAALASGAGFVDVTVDEVGVTFLAPDVDAHVDRVSSLAGPMSAAFAAATPDQLAGVRRTAADLAAPYVTDDGYALPGQALLLRARTAE